jgi:tRNA/tmRNA/rRNA uracil-C5-methylase (TrmA/RlmC/RlmD family)
MDNSFDWQKFWTDWRNKPAETEYDLFFQVAKTVNSRAMERQLFDSINQHILNELEITNTDTLVELCCGNGLCTYEFAQKANNVIAVDFSPHLIADAIRLKSASNICYIQKDVVDFVKTYIPDVPLRTVKCLMNDSLAYFVPDQLKEIVYALNANSGVHFSDKRNTQ